MRLYRKSVTFENTYYIFEPLTGSLLFKKDDFKIKNPKQKIKAKVEKALNVCGDPYLLKKQSEASSNYRRKSLMTIYAKVLVKLCSKSFALGRFFSNFAYPIFDTTAEAIDYFRNVYPSKIQGDLCYPRCLFAASLSKSFKKEGVIIIGVMLPSKSMHAWIIENGTQVDLKDNMWINFQPVATIY